MSGERSIEFLLNLYDAPYVRGEKLTNETQKKIRSESKRKNRHLLLDELLNESEALQLTPNSKKLVRYLIDDFNNDFKELHRKVKEETIILAFVFYVKKIEMPSVRLDSYKIFKKYGLTNHVFELILCRMLLILMEKSSIKPSQFNGDAHDILIREGKR